MENLIHKEITRLVEASDYYAVLFGNGFDGLAVDRANGDITAHLSFPFALDRDNVFGFRVGRQDDKNLLYLEFQAKDGKVEISVGAIRDVRTAEEWVRKVNPLYHRS